jgi:manganese transport protein
MRPFRKLGPGLVVTAAFIGPGTVTTASRAGADFGFSLLWAVVFATLATVVLQEMSARLGIAARQGLGEAIRSTFHIRIARFLAGAIVIAAIGLGNAAYQTGNLTGAALGLQVVLAGDLSLWAALLAGLAFALLVTGKYKLIERALVVLVVLMSLVFLLTALLVRPDPVQVIRGVAIPSVPSGSLLTILGLIGTTVVPYNLFLHASSVREKWPETIPVETALDESRRDTLVSISVGGLITLAIVTTAAATCFEHGTFRNAADMARQLEPLLGGPAARVAFALGLLAAGLTSAITAPLAAAYATAGILGWPHDLRAWRFRAVWMAVLLSGLMLAVTWGQSPTETILAAQVANGFLLPVVAGFLLLAVNRTDLMGRYRNGWAANALGIGVVLVALALGGWKILQQFGMGK